MPRQPARHDHARWRVDCVEEPQRQLGIVTLLFRRVREFLHVKVGENAQHGRAHIGPGALAERGNTIEAGRLFVVHDTLAWSAN